MINRIFSVLILSSSFYSLFIAAEELWKPQRNGQEFTELLLCRKCGTDVADAHYIFHKSSPGAHKVDKRKLFGRQNVTVLTLVNPFGVVSEVITTEKARCVTLGPAQGADSWFPNYEWRVCVCPQCGQQLGWTFESTFSKDSQSAPNEEHIEQFHGLKLSSVLGENYSLIVMPRAYEMR